MNIFNAMAVRSVEEATRAIPVIDFGPAFRSEPGGLDAAAAEVRHACEQVGFFYMASHGVPQPVVDAAFEAAREFHAMPLEDKMLALLDYAASAPPGDLDLTNGRGRATCVVS